ncbi:MAG TPA: TolC family protein, partial [Pyrinomonadaceae bacterium]|nr:TolC family protein [Pyrinomonadaceae bacterium]
NVEVKLLELRNLLGMQPDEPLRLNGDFNNLIDQPAPLAAAIEQALKKRPDLQFARTAQELAEARLQQARAGAKPDASLMAGYQRMNRMMPMIENPAHPEVQTRIQGENFITFGVEIDLPVRNRNQGMIEAAALEIEAARKRIEFGELTVRREVTAAYTRFERSVRALTIFRAGVREQAGQNLQVVWQTYELGSKSLLDYIAEERRYLDIENNLIEAEFETFRAKVEILRTTNAPELK